VIHQRELSKEEFDSAGEQEAIAERDWTKGV
jgi:hypothetical protein